MWIRADEQRAGRGRSGRPWSSPPGNLSATYLFTPACPRGVFHQLSFVAGVAGFDAITASVEGELPLQLKWPNDLLIGRAKLGGILVESCKYEGDVVVMIGMGVNITVAPDVDGREIAQLDAHGLAPTPQDLIKRLADAMAHWLTIWEGGENFSAIREAWQQRAHAVGQPLTVNTNQGQRAGTFAGLAENGALLLKSSSGETVHLEHGDVSLATTLPAVENRP